MLIIGNMKGRIKMENLQKNRKSLFCTASIDVQKTANNMLESFGNMPDENTVKDRCNTYCELHDLDYVLKQIDNMSEHLDKPDIIEETRQSVKDYYRIRRNAVNRRFEELECLSYQKGFKDAFKLFMKLIE